MAFAYLLSAIYEFRATASSRVSQSFIGVGNEKDRVAPTRMLLRYNFYSNVPTIYIIQRQHLVTEASGRTKAIIYRAIGEVAGNTEPKRAIFLVGTCGLLPTYSYRTEGASHGGRVDTRLLNDGR